MKRARLFLSGIVLVALASAGLSLRHETPKAKSSPSSPPKTEAVAQAHVPSYDDAVGQVRDKKKIALTIRDAEPGAWSRHAGVAAVTMGEAQLTGDYDAYVEADRALAQAFHVARATVDDENIGPNLLKAQLDYELHRLRPALAALLPVEKQAIYFHDQAQLAEVVSLRGAIHFQLGNYDEGLDHLRKSIELAPTAAHEQRLAIALAKVGDPEGAERIFAKTAAKTEAPRSLAWIELQRGKLALEHGKREAGRRHLENALTLFPGWWQPAEHLAELDAREGHTDRAIDAYRTLVEKTHDPEFMDALAALIAERDPEEARRLSERSNAIYEDRLAKLPEASYGHALEHFLEFSTDAARGVEIAQKNLALRPNGEARTRLAQAYVRAGRIGEARTAIAHVLATKWVSAETYATAAIIHRLAHDDAAATSLEAKAKSLNEHALDELDWLKPVTTT